jgi:hypothetical protein
MVAHINNPSAWEAEARGSRVQGQHGVQSETVSQEKKRWKRQELGPLGLF